LTTLVYNVAFIRVFRVELAKRSLPRYGDPAWSHALRVADRLEPASQLAPVGSELLSVSNLASTPDKAKLVSVPNLTGYRESARDLDEVNARVFRAACDRWLDKHVLFLTRLVIPLRRVPQSSHHCDLLRQQSKTIPVIPTRLDHGGHKRVVVRWFSYGRCNVKSSIRSGCNYLRSKEALPGSG
jgi:hypothetical protein